MEPRLYTCGLPDESIEEYKPGGYHPVRLGDAFRNGRYRILHKLGWGSYSTTWLARDDVENRNVALKVSSVDASKKLPGEKEILRALAALAKSHPGHSHIVSLLDSFTVNGPNGAHSCLVLELLGPSVHETNLHIFMNYAFPAPTVKRLAAQILSVIDLMSRHDIGHGDLHTNNIVFKIPELGRLPEQELLQLYSKPEMEPVERRDGGPLSDEVPPYLVEPATISYRLVKRILNTNPSVKIIDFGEAFFDKTRPERLNTAISSQAPEFILGDSLDRRVDLWAMGCMLFELAAAQPLFSSIYDTGIVEEMFSMANVDDQLPPRMLAKWRDMLSTAGRSDVSAGRNSVLHEWLEEVHSFHQPETASVATPAADVFFESDLAEICRLIWKLMRFEPRERAEAAEILEDPWFRGITF